MWTYIQSSGELIGPDDIHRFGYSGSGPHKNDPDSQNLHDLGPIPCGVYRIGDPFDSADHGPYVLPLKPDPANDMFGRAGFLIHGDSLREPGTASKGCIIQSRATRVAIVKSGDRELHVLAHSPLPALAVDPALEAE